MNFCLFLIAVALFHGGAESAAKKQSAATRELKAQDVQQRIIDLRKQRELALPNARQVIDKNISNLTKEWRELDPVAANFEDLKEQARAVEVEKKSINDRIDVLKKQRENVSDADKAAIDQEIEQLQADLPTIGLPKNTQPKPPLAKQSALEKRILNAIESADQAKMRMAEFVANAKVAIKKVIDSLRFLKDKKSIAPQEFNRVKNRLQDLLKGIDQSTVGIDLQQLIGAVNQVETVSLPREDVTTSAKVSFPPEPSAPQGLRQKMESALSGQRKAAQDVLDAMAQIAQLKDTVAGAIGAVGLDQLQRAALTVELDNLSILEQKLAPLAARAEAANEKIGLLLNKIAPKKEDASLKTLAAIDEEFDKE